jgi:hypothetical protein
MSDDSVTILMHFFAVWPRVLSADGSNSSAKGVQSKGRNG